MTTCEYCGVRTARMKPNRTGLMVPSCGECVPHFANGTAPGKVVAVQHRNAGDNTCYPLTPIIDFANHVGVNASREIEIATARAEGAVEVLRILVRAFERELASGYATPEQQQALRRARALIAEAE